MARDNCEAGSQQRTRRRSRRWTTPSATSTWATRSTTRTTPRTAAATTTRTHGRCAGVPRRAVAHIHTHAMHACGARLQTRRARAPQHESYTYWVNVGKEVDLPSLSNRHKECAGKVSPVARRQSCPRRAANDAAPPVVRAGGQCQRACSAAELRGRVPSHLRRLHLCASARRRDHDTLAGGSAPPGERCGIPGPQGVTA